jgi:hypothetical protein
MAVSFLDFLRNENIHMHMADRVRHRGKGVLPRLELAVEH